MNIWLILLKFSELFAKFWNHRIHIDINSCPKYPWKSTMRRREAKKKKGGIWLWEKMPGIISYLTFSVVYPTNPKPFSTHGTRWCGNNNNNSIQRVGGGRWAIKTEPADVHYSTPENTWRNFLVYVEGTLYVYYFSLFWLEMQAASPIVGNLNGTTQPYLPLPPPCLPISLVYWPFGFLINQSVRSSIINLFTKTTQPQPNN